MKMLTNDRKLSVKYGISTLTQLAVNYETVSKDTSATGLGELAFLHRITDTITLILKQMYELEDMTFNFEIEQE